jgi:hypothetical protein
MYTNGAVKCCLSEIIASLLANGCGCSGGERSDCWYEVHLLMWNYLSQVSLQLRS